MNKKYWIADQLDPDNTKRELTEDDVIKLSGKFDKEGIGYDSDEKAYKSTLFEIKADGLDYLQEFSVTYDTKFDWVGFTNACIENGLLTAEEVNNLHITFDNVGECGCQASYEHVNKQWSYPASYKKELKKSVKTINSGKYQWQIDYSSGTKDQKDFTLTDHFTNNISEKEYNSIGWHADLLASGKTDAASQYWLTQLLREYSLAKPVTVTVTMDGVVNGTTYENEKVGTFTFGNNETAKGQALDDDEFHNITGETLTYDKVPYGFTLKASNLPKQITLHLSYTTEFDQDKYQNGIPVTEDGMKLYTKCKDKVSLENTEKSRLHNEVNAGITGNTDQKEAETEYKLSAQNNGITKTVTNDKLDTLIYRVDVDTDYLSGSARTFTVDDTLDPAYTKYLTLQDIGVIQVSGDTKDELNINAEEAWKNIQNQINSNQMALSSPIINSEHYQYLAEGKIGNQKLTLNDAENGLKKVNGFKGLHIETNGPNGAYQRTILVYKLKFDFDQFKADGNEQVKVNIKNDAVLKANGYSDKSASSTGTVEKKKLFEKESVSKDGTSELRWDIKVNLNEKYSKAELENASDATITDVLPNGLKVNNINVTYNDGASTVNSLHYKSTVEGQTVQVKLLHPGKTPEVIIHLSVSSYGDFDSIVNKASLVVNNKKINTKSDPIEDVKTAAYSRGWIRSYSAKLPDTTGTIRLTKTDSVSKNRLPGVTFTLTDVNGAIVPVVKDDTGYHYMTDEDIDIESKDELVTNSVGEIVVTGLPVGKYYFTESKALSGYMKNTEKYEANLTKEDIDNRENKDIQFVKDIEATNAPTRVSIEKTNIETKELIAGAKLAIYKTKDMDGNVPKEDAVPVKTWTSESSAKEIDALIPGEYVLYEQEAPAGYLQAEPVKFTVIMKEGLQKVAMEDDFIKTSFTKKDAETREALSGAKVKQIGELQNYYRMIQTKNGRNMKR